MTVRASWGCWCDGCDELLSRIDLGDESARQSRYYAKEDGAHVARPGGRDICAECWAKGVR